MTITVDSQARGAIRQDIRNRRRALSVEQQRAASIDAATQLLKELDGARRIALYLENDGEIGTGPLIEALWNSGCELYLPVLHPFSEGHLLFVRFEPETPIVANIYGIPEPTLACHRLCPAYRLDAIITPLVAFDNAGNRLGMGGGFYDRTLAQLPATTLVIGLAHDCQRLPALPAQSWDIPLPVIVTPQQVFRFG